MLVDANVCAIALSGALGVSIVAVGVALCLSAKIDMLMTSQSTPFSFVHLPTPRGNTIESGDVGKGPGKSSLL
jgi:hypothetical protein